jgi:hypothetical protein
MKRQMIETFTLADWEANVALENELSDLREDLAPSWLVRNKKHRSRKIRNKKKIKIQKKIKKKK